MEQESVNQRLNLIVDTFEKGKKAAFARKAGISPQGAQEILAGRKGDPSFKVLVKILESYPTVDANWLVLGRGPMLREADAEPVQQEPTSLVSAEQVESILKEAIITQLGLDPAVRREANEAAIRAEQIAGLELAILDLRMQIEDLNHRGVLIRNGGGESNGENDEELLAKMKDTYNELSKDLHGKYHLVMALRQQEKRALQEALALSGQAVYGLIKGSKE